MKTESITGSSQTLGTPIGVTAASSRFFEAATTLGLSRKSGEFKVNLSGKKMMTEYDLFLYSAGLLK